MPLRRLPRPACRGEFGATEGGVQCVAGGSPVRENGPLDGRTGVVGQREPGRDVGDLDQHLYRTRGRHGFEQLADGGDRGFVAGEDKAGAVGVDGVAPPGT